MLINEHNLGLNFMFVSFVKYFPFFWFFPEKVVSSLQLTTASARFFAKFRMVILILQKKLFQMFTFSCTLYNIIQQNCKNKTDAVVYYINVL